jgi:hypothetical protein
MSTAPWFRITPTTSTSKRSGSLPENTVRP